LKCKGQGKHFAGVGKSFNEKVPSGKAAATVHHDADAGKHDQTA